ncbi:MAG: HDOD domain-containing protein, partial [Desulfobacterales bacterium]|nr:HDOD domain-containing protein [Desulfobacterales bacterium]
TGGVDAKLAAPMQRLREDGYQIVLSPGHQGPDDPLLPLADIISAPVAELDRDQLEALHRKFTSGAGRLLAAQVQSQSAFKACRDIGFDLFQGPFFKQPEKISMDKISSSESSRFQLLRMIEQEDPDVSELSEIISADVSISLRLLSYINSAAFGLRRKVQSIREAINMLGWQHIKNWLRILVLSDAARNQNASELMRLSAQRGKFLEQVAEDHDFWGFNPERLFLLGLFSLTDAMLNRAMADIVRHLPLDETLKSALCRQKNNELLPFIHMVECFEDDRWDEAGARVQALGLNAAKVNTAFQNAVDWASEMATVTA